MEREILKFYFTRSVEMILDVTLREARRKFWDFTNEEDNKKEKKWRK